MKIDGKISDFSLHPSVHLAVSITQRMSVKEMSSGFIWTF